jgi:hypothetical protein
MGETCEGPPSGNGDPRNASCVAADNFENKLGIFTKVAVNRGRAMANAETS